MNKDKWLDISLEERNKYHCNLFTIQFVPEDWSKHKDFLMEFINEMDKATEVYFMENTKETE